MGSTGGDVGRPAPYPSSFYQSLSNPKQAPSSTNKPNVSFGPMSFKPTPLRPPHPYPIVFPQLPTCCLSRFHIFMISELPYPTSLSEVQDVSKRSEGSLINISRIFMETTPHCPTQCLSTKRQCEMKFEENPKEKNTCVLKKGNPRSLSEEESPKW